MPIRLRTRSLPTTLNNKKHDSCATCHTSATDLTLVALASGGVGGGAVCTTCHTGRVWNDHSIDHSTSGYVTLAANCNSCHTATVTSGQAFVDAANNVKHDACTVCHNADGTLQNSWTSGDCTQCHSVDWYSVHTSVDGVDHTASGLNAVLPEPAGSSRTVSCSSANCHAAQGDIITGVHDIYAPTGGTNMCQECHNSSGALIVGNDGYGDATLGSAGGATCSTCHTGGSDNHLHDHSTTVTFNAGTDLAQSAPGTACNECHGVGASSPYSLANWSDKLYEHDFVNAPQDGIGACTSCHDYDTRGDQTGDANAAGRKITGAIDNNIPVTCIGCHAAKVQPNTHGGHDDPDTHYLQTTECVACHDSQSDRNYINDIHGRRWNNGSYPTLDSNCEVCHINNVPGATLQDYSGGGLLMPTDTYDYGTIVTASDGDLTCLECHSPGPAPSEIISVLSANFTETGGGPNAARAYSVRSTTAAVVLPPPADVRVT